MPEGPAAVAFQWDQIDHELVALKLSALAVEMNEAIGADERRIRFEVRKSGNSAGYGRAFVEMYKRRADEWAQRNYEIYCDVWVNVQRGTKTADFVRAVLEKGIQPLIAALTARAIEELKSRQARTRSIPNLHALMGAVTDSMERLRADWKRKLEIEAREYEHAARKQPPSISSKSEAERLGRRRAQLVGQLITELNALKPELQVPEEDYTRLCSQYPDCQVFKICKQHATASKWVKLVPDRPRVNTLAYEIAAIHFGVTKATIQTAWKRYKPRSKSR